MNTFEKQVRSLACALGVVLLASVLRAQTPPPDQFSTARDVVLQAFPALKGRTVDLVANVPLSVDQQVSWFQMLGVTVTETVDRGGQHVEETLGNVVLYFEPPGYVYRWRTSGSLVSSTQNAELKRRVDEHPEWSDERILSELRGAGAQFIPDASMSPDRALVARLMSMSSFLGTIQVQSVTFKIRNKLQLEAHYSAAELYWLVFFDVVEPGGHLREDCFALFEPFTGNVTSLEAGDR